MLNNTCSSSVYNIKCIGHNWDKGAVTFPKCFGKFPYPKADLHRHGSPSQPEADDGAVVYMLSTLKLPRSRCAAAMVGVPATNCYDRCACHLVVQCNVCCIQPTG